MELTCQEIEVWYILPAIRREIAKVLMEKHSYNQKQVADFLGVTKAAVSQWISNKRAKEDIIDFKTRKNVESAVEKMLENKSLIAREIGKLCHKITKSKITCKVHKNHSKNMLNCDACR